MIERFQHFIQNATKSVSQLPHTRFHQLINQALWGPLKQRSEEATGCSGHKNN